MTPTTMRALRFHGHGEPADVLILEEATVPQPGRGHVLVKVEACSLNPADWALCRGLHATALPRGIGLDVSGTVVAVGEGVTDVVVGDAVFGPADYMNHPTAGAADYAILYHWDALPTSLSHVQAAALPLVVETAARYFAWSGVQPGQTLLVNGAGTMVGFAAVQMALAEGITVVATAGATFTDPLREMGATVTAHGEGMVERLRALLPQPPDAVIDVAPVNLQPGSTSALPALVELVGGEARRIITVADFETAAATGVRTGVGNVQAEGGLKLRWDVLGTYAQRTAEGRFSIPVAKTFALTAWRDALDVSLAGRARGKLVLVPPG